jgi:hypothetical protein
VSKQTNPHHAIKLTQRDESLIGLAVNFLQLDVVRDSRPPNIALETEAFVAERFHWWQLQEIATEY